MLSKELAGLLAHASREEEPRSSCKPCKPCDDLTISFVCTKYANQWKEWRSAAVFGREERCLQLLSAQFLSCSVCLDFRSQGENTRFS